MGAGPEMGWWWWAGRGSPRPGWGTGGRGKCRLRDSLLGDTGEEEGDPGRCDPRDDPAKKLWALVLFPAPLRSPCPLSLCLGLLAGGALLGPSPACRHGGEV